MIVTFASFDSCLTASPRIIRPSQYSWRILSMEYSLSKLRFPLALMAVLVMSACGKTPDTAASMPAAKVSVAKVMEQPVNEWDDFTGSLEAPETVERTEERRGGKECVRTWRSRWSQNQ